eukprot:TRINITY_DN49507_c0_g1_i1.p4 TRINITY_DN49507_c0_g1~~TRINITY_DN49507_c0_g1_i1.p4  ORF type:complete len:566 (+),score=82.24 TRINITY_DN49507_c0_g1_i1:5140-6837(+)
MTVAILAQKSRRSGVPGRPRAKEVTAHCALHHLCFWLVHIATALRIPFLRTSAAGVSMHPQVGGSSGSDGPRGGHPQALPSASRNPQVDQAIARAAAFANDRRQQVQSAQRRQDFQPARQRSPPPHRAVSHDRTRSREYVRPPPGLPEPPSAMDTLVSKLTQVLEQVTQCKSMDFKDIPVTLQKALIKIERELETNVDKLLYAEQKLDKYNKLSNKNEFPQAIDRGLKRQKQFSKFEITNAAITANGGWNPAEQWDKLRSEIAKKEMEYEIKYLQHTIMTFKALSNQTWFGGKIREVLMEFNNYSQAGNDFNATIRAAEAWASTAFIKVHSDARVKLQAKLEKVKKQNARLAENVARFEGLSTEGLITTGLLDAANVLFKELAVDGANRSSRTPTSISSSSTLGHLLTRNKELAKKFNLQVVDSLSHKPVLSRPKSRPASRASSFDTARSKSLSSARSGRSRSNSRSSVSRSSRRSRSTSRSNHSSRGRQASGSRGSSRFRSASRGSSRSNKSKGSVFRVAQNTKGRQKKQPKTNHRHRSSSAKKNQTRFTGKGPEHKHGRRNRR